MDGAVLRGGGKRVAMSRGDGLRLSSGQGPGSRRTDHLEEESRTSLANEMVLFARVCGSARFCSVIAGATGSECAPLVA